MLLLAPLSLGQSTPEDSIALAIACRPSPRQLAWQATEFNAFVHFGPNTFTDHEWGEGTEDPAVFLPTDFDADQWVQAFSDAGMRGVILTAKHHDGFCLWPTSTTPHSVASSPWRGGGGDVVAEVSAACARRGMRFGFYLSPADLNAIVRGVYGNGSAPAPSVIPHAADGAPPPACTFEFVVDDYNRVFLTQLYELLTGYGPVFEVWFDGANPKPGTGQRYDYQAWYSLIRELAPEAVIAIKGPDVRWVGNEAGQSRAAEWSVIPLDAPPDRASWPDMMGPDLGGRDKLRAGAYCHWYPAEVDVSIRPGWFYHASQDAEVKDLDHLLRIYDASVGNNSVLLLNVPPDRRGRIHEHDVRALRELGEVVRATFQTDLISGARASASSQASLHGPHAAIDADPATYWAAPDGVESCELVVELAGPRAFDVATLAEPIAEGQRVERFAIDARGADGSWVEIGAGETIGAKKIVRVSPTTTDAIRLRVVASRVRPAIAELGLFDAPERAGVSSP